MIRSDLCDLPVYVQRSCQSESRIKEATYSTAWWVMSEQWHYTESRSVRVHNDDEEPDICSQWTWELKMFSVAQGSKIYQQIDRGPRGEIQCHRYPLEMKRRVLLLRREAVSCIFSWVKETVFFYLEINMLWENLFIFFFSVLRTLSFSK